ncbi:PIN-like domain-containing protein [Fodinibius sp. Rm-B-1B1-1]|uniref:PIN-like domain-containing protein n=1 Tax=Fodinibius alkaliphilus TaxID=3140241 RepID=UPI00315B0A0B
MEDKEKNIWESEPVIVFDTSTLLDFYFYPQKTREKIYNNVFKKLDNRLWIPNHVYFEFLKNRKSVIKKPINKSYLPLRDTLKRIQKGIEKIENNYKDFHQKSKKPDRFPHIDEELTKQYSDLVEKVEEEITNFNDKLITKIEEAETEIKETVENDDHFEKIKEFFSVGRSYNFSELLEIVKEGELRYRNNIPPGYKDSDKDGIQKFGDLIIWKQILEFIESEKKNLIFVIDDQKEDWIKETSGENYFPRLELEMELNSVSGKELWIYNQTDFLRAANEILEAQFDPDDLLTIEEYLEQKSEFEEDPVLICKCNDCGFMTEFYEENLFIDWQHVASYDRNMGPELEYEAILNLPCKNCQKNFEIIFRGWEYPMGAVNSTDIENYGCEIIDVSFPKVPVNI